jgi:hypothetical protein
VIHKYGTVVEYWLTGGSRRGSGKNLLQSDFIHHKPRTKSSGNAPITKWRDVSM